jgi:hypothetical protein
MISHAGQKVSPPCLWPFVRQYPGFFWASFYEDDMHPVLVALTVVRTIDVN